MMHQDKSVQNLSKISAFLIFFFFFFIETVRENHLEHQPLPLCLEGCLVKKPSCCPQYRIG